MSVVRGVRLSRTVLVRLKADPTCSRIPEGGPHVRSRIALYIDVKSALAGLRSAGGELEPGPGRLIGTGQMQGERAAAPGSLVTVSCAFMASAIRLASVSPSPVP